MTKNQPSKQKKQTTHTSQGEGAKERGCAPYRSLSLSSHSLGPAGVLGFTLASSSAGSNFSSLLTLLPGLQKMKSLLS